jgi:hypothetical protein
MGSHMHYELGKRILDAINDGHHEEDPALGQVPHQVKRVHSGEVGSSVQLRLHGVTEIRCHELPCWETVSSGPVWLAELAESSGSR